MNYHGLGLMAVIFIEFQETYSTTVPFSIRKQAAATFKWKSSQKMKSFEYYQCSVCYNNFEFRGLTQKGGVTDEVTPPMIYECFLSY